MDFLDINLGEMTLIEKQKHTKFFFPAVTFSKDRNTIVASFNKLCGEKFNKAKYLKIFGNAEYLIFVPSNSEEANAYKLNYNRGLYPVTASRSLERFAVDGKTYKVYQTKKGFAIKLNEPVVNRKE
jgi:hypothetical protein